MLINQVPRSLAARKDRGVSVKMGLGLRLALRIYGRYLVPILGDSHDRKRLPHLDCLRRPAFLLTNDSAGRLAATATAISRTSINFANTNAASEIRTSRTAISRNCPCAMRFSEITHSQTTVGHLGT